jgi:hypothetical protein
MRILTISDLMRLNRIELCHLARRMERKLLTYSADSPHYAAALINLRNIRVVLARLDLAP